MRAVAVITTLLLALLLVRHFDGLGWGLLERPRTVLDHVLPKSSLSRHVIVLARQLRERIPHGATVTAIAPEQAPHYDPTLYLTAAGILLDHRVIHPDFNDPSMGAEYVIAVGGQELVHPDYEQVDELAHGRLYRRRQ